MYHEIRVAEFRMDEETMLKRFNSKILPILAKEDPLSLKLIQDSHTGNIPFQKLHR